MKSSLFVSLLVLSINSFSQAQYPLGEKEFTQDKEQATVFTSYNELSLPKLKDSIDLSYMMPPAGNQGDKGACWAWATTYTLRSIMDNQNTFLNGKNIDETKVYSPEYVYQYYKGDIDDCEWGAVSKDMLGKILKDGAVKYADFPYYDKSCNRQPTQDLKIKAQEFIKKDYVVTSVDNLYSIKKVLSDNQPLIISIKVDDFFCKRGNITAKSPFWNSFGTKKGTHAMVVVGYNDRIKALKVLNSHGLNFGDKGYVWISYSIVNSAMNYCCFPTKDKASTISLTQPKTENTSTQGTTWPQIAQSFSSWFKAGYYRVFDKLRVGISGLSKSKKFATIDIIDSNGNLITNFYIDLKSSKQFYVNNVKYTFTFDNIGRAGKDRFFSWAAFFTISK